MSTLPAPRNRLKSRKFWSMVASEIIALSTGLGLKVDPVAVMAICSAIPLVFLIIEGIIDAFRR